MSYDYADSHHDAKIIAELRAEITALKAARPSLQPDREAIAQAFLYETGMFDTPAEIAANPKHALVLAAYRAADRFTTSPAPGVVEGDLREVLLATRKVLLNSGYCGPGKHGAGDPEVNRIDVALARTPPGGYYLSAAMSDEVAAIWRLVHDSRVSAEAIGIRIRNKWPALEIAAPAIPPGAPTGAGEWRPIDTAPKDGSVILAVEQSVDEYGNLMPPDYMAVNWNTHHRGWICFGLHFESYKPTHWQPLPEPPSLSDASASSDAVGRVR